MSVESGVRVAENSVGLGFLYSVTSIKPILTHEKIFGCGKKWPKCHKSGPNATFNPAFLGLGWPWDGEFDSFIITFLCFLSLIHI